MRKFVKKIVIGTAAALLVTTGVFASGWENAAESQASPQPQACSWCQEKSHCYEDIDKDGICDYYSSHRNCTHSCRKNSGFSHHCFTH